MLHQPHLLSDFIEKTYPFQVSRKDLHVMAASSTDPACLLDLQSSCLALCTYEEP